MGAADFRPSCHILTLRADRAAAVDDEDKDDDDLETIKRDGADVGLAADLRPAAPQISLSSQMS